jgi:histone deacetylase complex regulatory component SIN3
MDRRLQQKHILIIEKSWDKYPEKYPDNNIFYDNKIVSMKNITNFTISSGIGTEEEIIKVVHCEEVSVKKLWGFFFGFEVVVEMSVVDTNSEEKSGYSYDESSSSECKVIKELISGFGKGFFDINDSESIERNFEYSNDPKNQSVNSINENEEYETE